MRQPYSDNCYKVILERMDWETSRLRCASIGSHLAVIDNAAANHFVVEHLKTLSAQGKQGLYTHIQNTQRQELYIHCHIISLNLSMWVAFS